MIGCSMPNISVIAVFTSAPDVVSRMSGLAALLPVSGRAKLPLLAERANLELEGPCAARLLIKQPIGFCDRRWRHQEIWIVQRVRTERLDPPLPHPFRVDAGIDDEMRHVDVLWTQFTRGRLRNGPQAELGAGESRISRPTTEAR